MSVTPLRPPPTPHVAECANGCSGVLRGSYGACQKQCAKTPEFREQSAREAEANRLRFLTAIGANTLTKVQP